VGDRPSYDRKLLQILRDAAGVFAEKGYHRASIRDISAATDVSLSGLYYYFSSKEELLFLVQNHCFGTLLARLEEDLSQTTDPAARLRIVVRNHLHFFLDNMEEMKVLSHEADVLTGKYRETIQRRKRSYADTVHGILSELRPADGPDLRTATFALFGMMNWIYTWYNPDRDLRAEEMEEELLHLFLNGFLAPRNRRSDGEGGDSAPMEHSSIWRSG